mmetsp:Transcript_3895/g.8287  ORF Transcript_3895/g.8287 Transcript_3895/m.8287 type:complete len:211 (-) Transcript_3895:49-681(-)|eukprot:CAMPEP_0183314200 /NCGR_PEP_ID=MMETSP0160_2-20130417/47713_1 /TAXON_ID=2839 ORGANISM="Odontella Sinensis, Strain Grunow 1884" /NCGR_SAMPLE_ID=MMETSP0160_2 /ASSEMBLY_ACC=CAM_ASM_000250 /LENGTH=210 /DNA_ID=CAMNT_0025479469 /DNA_START=168 /DNA_END=800 /DNA_ORIENTATION=-
MRGPGIILFALSLCGSADAFSPNPRAHASRLDTSLRSFTVPGMWNGGNAFGKGEFKFYKNFDSWMKPFADEDRAAFPEVFNMPEGVYEVGLGKPLGIVFEEIESGKGVYVQDLVEGGMADRMGGRIQKGDVLVGITAVKIVGAKWERRLIPARNFDFDTVVGAIGSNDPKWGCNDVICMFERPGVADPAKTDAFLDFFEPPFDNPWKQQQ